ncbi:MAG: hypothetical protein B6D61_13740 [Bacteroidetes bacterium 4484_249]|nr:MAG: hypothetical protein B6D61_13740 [Bacteroidetes bacterium 4484_249]
MRSAFFIYELKRVMPFFIFIAFFAFGCETDEKIEKKNISVEFTFEVQVHDTVSIPLAGETVYMDTRKYDNGTVKGIFEDMRTTNQDGWAIKYVGYNLDESSDYVVFHASLNGYNNYDPPVVHKIVYYNELKSAANGNDHLTYTVTGFLEKLDY